MFAFVMVLIDAARRRSSPGRNRAPRDAQDCAGSAASSLVGSPAGARSPVTKVPQATDDADAPRTDKTTATMPAVTGGLGNRKREIAIQQPRYANASADRRRVHAGRATMPARTGKTTALLELHAENVSQIAGSPNPRARMNRCAANTATPRPAYHVHKNLRSRVARGAPSDVTAVAWKRAFSTVSGRHLAMARCTARSDVRRLPRNTTSVEAKTQTAERHQPALRTCRTVGWAAFVSSGLRPSPSPTNLGR